MRYGAAWLMLLIAWTAALLQEMDSVDKDKALNILWIMAGVFCAAITIWRLEWVMLFQARLDKLQEALAYMQYVMENAEAMIADQYWEVSSDVTSDQDGTQRWAWRDPLRW